jgi:hypothetical protein
MFGAGSLVGFEVLGVECGILEDWCWVMSDDCYVL